MDDAAGLRVLFAGVTMVPDWTGGEPTFAHLLKRGMEELGAEVTVEGSRRTLGELATFAVMPFDIEPNRVARYRRRLRDLHPDVVLAFYDFDCSLIVAARKERIPVIACVQIYWATCPIGTRYIEGVGVCSAPGFSKCLRHMSVAEPSPNLGLPVPGLPAPLGFLLYAKLWTRFATLSQVDAFAVPSEGFREILNQAGYRRVHVIHDAVDTGLFKAIPWQGPSKVVLYPVARSLQERKGYPHFVQMAQLVRKRLPEVRFRVLNHRGDDLLEGTPYLTREQLAEEMASDYLAVVPGLWDEPFGTVTVESMAAGRPVVAYECSVYREIIENGVSGILVRRGNVQELSEAVFGLLTDEDAARRMGRAARQRVETHFTYQLMAKRYLSLIRSVMGGSGRGGSNGIVESGANSAELTA